MRCSVLRAPAGWPLGLLRTGACGGRANGLTAMPSTPVEGLGGNLVDAECPIFMWEMLESLRSAGYASRRQFPLHPGGGMLGKFRGVLQIELLLDLFAIILNCLNAQVKLPSNLTRLLPLADKLEDFQFPTA
jgi:hypothetical protein